MQKIAETMHGQDHTSNHHVRMTTHAGTATTTTTIKEIVMKGVIQIVHTTDQTEFLRVIGRVVDTALVIGESGHADFGM